MEEFIPADAMGIACWIIDDRSNSDGSVESNGIDFNSQALGVTPIYK